MLSLLITFCFVSFFPTFVLGHIFVIPEAHNLPFEPPVTKLLPSSPSSPVFEACVYTPSQDSREQPLREVYSGRQENLTGDQCARFCFSRGFDRMGLKYSNVCTCGTKEEFALTSANLIVSKSLCESSCAGDSSVSSNERSSSTTESTSGQEQGMMATLEEIFAPISSFFGNVPPTRFCGSREYTAIHKLKPSKPAVLSSSALVHSERSRPLFCVGILAHPGASDEEIVSTAAQFSFSNAPKPSRKTTSALGYAPVCILVLDTREETLSSIFLRNALDSTKSQNDKKAADRTVKMMQELVHVIPFRQHYRDDAHAFNTLLRLMRGKSEGNGVDNIPNLPQNLRPIFGVAIHSGDAVSRPHARRLRMFLETNRLSWGSSHNVYEAEIRTLLCEGPLENNSTNNNIEGIDVDKAALTLSEIVPSELRRRMINVQRAVYHDGPESDDHGGNSVFLDAAVRRSERFFQFSSFGVEGRAVLRAKYDKNVQHNNSTDSTDSKVSHDTLKSSTTKAPRCEYSSASRPFISRLDWGAAYHGRFLPELSTVDLRRSPSAGFAPGVFSSLPSFHSLQSYASDVSGTIDSNTDDVLEAFEASLDARLAVRVTKTPRLFVPAPLLPARGVERDLLQVATKAILSVQHSSHTTGNVVGVNINDGSDIKKTRNQADKIENGFHSSAGPFASWAANFVSSLQSQPGSGIVQQPIGECDGRVLGTFTSDPCFPSSSSSSSSSIPFALVTQQLYLSRVAASVEILSGDILTETDPLSALGHLARLSASVGDHALSVALWAQIQARTTWSLELTFSCLSQALSLKALSVSSPPFTSFSPTASSSHASHASYASYVAVKVHPGEWRDMLERAHGYSPRLSLPAFMLALDFLAQGQSAAALLWARASRMGGSAEPRSGASEYDYSQARARFFWPLGEVDAYASSALIAFTTFQLGGPKNALHAWAFASETLHALQFEAFRSIPVPKSPVQRQEQKKRWEKKGQNVKDMKNGKDHLIHLPVYTGDRGTQGKLPMGEHFATPLIALTRSFLDSKTLRGVQQRQKKGLSLDHDDVSPTSTSDIVGKESKKLQSLVGYPGVLSPRAVLFGLQSRLNVAEDQVEKSDVKDEMEFVFSKTQVTRTLPGIHELLLTRNGVYSQISAPRALLQGVELTLLSRGSSHTLRGFPLSLHLQLSEFEKYILPRYIASSGLYQFMCFIHERAREASLHFLGRDIRDPLPVSSFLRWAATARTKRMNDRNSDYKPDHIHIPQSGPLTSLTSPSQDTSKPVSSSDISAITHGSLSSNNDIVLHDEHFGLWFGDVNTMLEMIDSNSRLESEGNIVSSSKNQNNTLLSRDNDGTREAHSFSASNPLLSSDAVNFLRYCGIEISPDRVLLLTLSSVPFSTYLQQSTSFAEMNMMSKKNTRNNPTLFPSVIPAQAIQSTPVLGYSLEYSFDVRGLSERNIAAERIDELVKSSRLTQEHYREASPFPWLQLLILTIVGLFTYFWLQQRLESHESLINKNARNSKNRHNLTSSQISSTFTQNDDL